MVDKNISSQDYSLSQKEILSIDNYRKVRETSVLTVMFTDIKGFTALTENKGEVFSEKVRNTHDDLLVPIIEENNEGLIVKHIGDSIMAVFSEPSTAVARAVKIQQTLHKFNKESSADVKLEVRIGLHMGQIAIENNIDIDLFGRHVNRASRVEGLADGGQIFMTYPVFDSARGWIDKHKLGNISWKKHGAYFLKGIKEPIEIYEVVDTNIQTHKPPQKTKKQRRVPKLPIIISLVALGIILAFVFMQFQKTQVWLSEFWPEHVYFNKTGEKILLDDNPVGKNRKIMNKIKPGDYLIYYNVSRMVRFYAPLKVKRGKNYIKAKFKEYRLPSVYRNISLNKRNNYKDELIATRKVEYSLFNIDNKEISKKVEITIKLSGEKTSQAEYKFTAEWKLTLNGEDINSGKKTSSEELRQKFKLFEDELHYYELNLNLCVGTRNNNANIEILSGFKDTFANDK